MAMKIVSQQTKKFTINGKEVECVVTRSTPATWQCNFPPWAWMPTW